ncbi:MAG: hypothetical protein GC152_09690 [Alphaproteobacteria bacterium]|nr:hypothetical protein [Alphaproteobacteria bacterium]
MRVDCLRPGSGMALLVSVARSAIPFALAIAFVGGASANTIDSAPRTVSYEIASKALGETRTLLLRTPPAHDDKATLPVVYVLDGEWNFEIVAAYVDYMVDNGVFPPMAIAGAINVNRNRDYLPKPDQYFPDSGGGAAYLDFVENEWIPSVERRISASGERVLIGHSFGGVATLNALFERPDLFDGYIALSASAWIADRILFDKARDYFDDHPEDVAFVYMSAGEFDGGPTTPSGRELAEIFAARASGALDWSFEVTPAAEHFRNFTTGLDRAFQKLIPYVGLVDEALEAGRIDGAAVDAWAAKKSSELGFRFFPPWFDLGVAATSLAGEGHKEGARALAALVIRYHAEDPNAAAFNAQTLEAVGDLEAAVDEYRRAIAITKARELHPNEIHFDRLRAGVARIEKKITERD